MRHTPWLAFALFVAPWSTAFAQTTTPGAVTFNIVTRLNSPRQSEFLGGHVPTTEPIGRRDCSCESWRFQGTYTPPAGATQVEFWIGETATSCSSLMSRMPGLSTTTCWQIATVPSAPVSATHSLDITIPARYLVDPINGQCVPPGGLSASMNTLYLSVLLRPPDDNTTVGTYAFTYNVSTDTTTLLTPYNTTASGQDQQALIRWQIGTVTVDGGVSTVPDSVRGYYVMCNPQAANVDAGTPCEGGVSLSDVVGTDAAVDAAVDADAGDGDIDGAVADGGTSMDAAVETGTDVPDAGSAVCAIGVVDFPTGFDPNDQTQFNQYVCSGLIPRTTTSATIQGLSNGTTYRFAVVAQDNAGNRSVLSNSACAMPQPITDFWEHYRGSGGTGHSGFCSARPGPARSGRGAAIGILSAIGLTTVLRRRRRGRPVHDHSSGDDS